MNELDLKTQQRNLKVTRLYYFLLSGTGFVSPYLNIFFVRLGLDGAQIGTVKSFGAIMILIAAPVWASASEKRRNPARLLQLALVLTALAYLMLSQQSEYLGILLTNGILSLLSAGVSPLSDALALAVTRVSRTGFGNIRVRMSIGWILFVLSCAWLIDRVGMIMAFAGVSAAFLVGAGILSPISAESFVKRRPMDTFRAQLGSVIHKLLHNWPLIGLGLMLAVTGLANSGVTQFEDVFLSRLGASDTLVGVAGILSAVVEIPCMFWADRLLNRRRTAYWLLMLSMFLMAAVRALVFAVPTIPVVMAQRALNGIGFSFYTVALIRVIAEQTLPQETRTTLALYNVTLVNVINIVSSPLAGAAFDLVGLRPMYAIAAAGYLLGWLGLYVANRRHTRRLALAS